MSSSKASQKTSVSDCIDPLEFRRLGHNDAEAMAELEKRCFSLPWSFAQCQGALGQKAFAAFGLVGRNALIAYISVYHAAGEMEIVNLAVDPRARRRGLGRRILDMILQVARKMGMQRVLLEVRQNNLAALALYRSAGFVTIGRRAGYYPDTGEDALVQEIQLNSEGKG